MTSYLAEEANFSWAAPPGRMLQREIDSRGISQAQLAARTNLSTKHVNLVIKGKAPLSPEMAVSLEQVLGTSAEVWLRMEADWRAVEAREARQASLQDFTDWAANFPRDVLISRGLVDPEDKPVDVVRKLLSIFGVSSPNAYVKSWLEPQASYKRSQLHAIDPHLTALWLRIAEREAMSVLDSSPKFDPTRLAEVANAIPGLSRLHIAAGFREAQKLLQAAGVGLVFVPEMRNTRISGVSRWVGDHPMIALTSRYKALDSFWFALLHETAHVLLHPKRGTYIDYTGKANDNVDALESAANEFAGSLLLPPKYEAQLVRATTVRQIKILADAVGVDAGVLAGMRGHLTGEWGGPIAKLRQHLDLENVLRDN